MVCAALVFQWMKGDRFIRPEMNQHTYLSENGNLYFSEVQAADAVEYMCIVTLIAPPDAVLATSQPLYGNSLGIQLNIDGEGWCSDGTVDTSMVELRLNATVILGCLKRDSSCAQLGFFIACQLMSVWKFENLGVGELQASWRMDAVLGLGVGFTRGCLGMDASPTWQSGK